MLVISTRELTQNQNKFFELAHTQRVIVKRKNRFFHIIDLGESIPELDDTLMSKEDYFAKLDKSLEQYNRGEYKTLRTKQDIDKFLGLD